MEKSDVEHNVDNLKYTQAGDLLTDTQAETEPKDKSSTPNEHDASSSTSPSQSEDTLPDLRPGAFSEEEFNSDEWMDLIDNREILKKVLFTKEKDPQNPTLPRANRGCRVLINLETKIYSTHQVISSESFQNLEVIVGDYDVITGLDLVLPMMYLYERSRVLLSPRFAYGSKGRLPHIEPDSRLDCTIEVVKILDDLELCSVQEKVKIAEKKKERGNFWFSREEYQMAITCYRKCVEMFENINEAELDEKAHLLLIHCYNNLSIAQLKTDALNSALESVNQALFYDGKNVKTLYRKAQILEKKSDLEEAVELLKSAIELEPNNHSVANLLTAVRKRRLIELENETRLYQKMISANKKQQQETSVQKSSGDDEDSSSRQSLSTRSSSKASNNKKFNYVLFVSSAIVALLLAFLINNYLVNYA